MANYSGLYAQYDYNRYHIDKKGASKSMEAPPLPAGKMSLLKSLSGITL